MMREAGKGRGLMRHEAQVIGVDNEDPFRFIRPIIDGMSAVYLLVYGYSREANDQRPRKKEQRPRGVGVGVGD